MQVGGSNPSGHTRLKNNLKYSQAILESAVCNSKSVLEVLRFLELPLTTSNHRHINSRIKHFNINTSHFMGRSNNRKKEFTKITDTEVLVYNRCNGVREKVFRLKRAMINAGIKEQCNCCSINSIWNNKDLTLQIDHINGDSLDNRKENLRFLCPNCHSQTENFGIKNIKKV